MPMLKERLATAILTLSYDFDLPGGTTSLIRSLLLRNFTHNLFTVPLKHIVKYSDEIQIVLIYSVSFCMVNLFSFDTLRCYTRLEYSL